jgi:hypothetical protein
MARPQTHQRIRRKMQEPYYVTLLRGFCEVLEDYDGSLCDDRVTALLAAAGRVVAHFDSVTRVH